MFCWRRLLRVPWTARRSNQSILKEIDREYSLEGLKMKLKFQYFSHLIGRAKSLEKTRYRKRLRAVRERQRMRWFGDITDSLDVNLSKLQVIVKDREAWHAAVHGVTKNCTQLRDWMTTVGCFWIEKRMENRKGWKVCRWSGWLGLDCSSLRKWILKVSWYKTWIWLFFLLKRQFS